MKRYILLFASAALVFSCATAPKIPDTPPVEDTKPIEVVPVEVKPVEVKPDEKVLDLPPAALLEKAKELKKTAFELALFEVMPDEYKSAEAALLDGATSYEKDNKASKLSLEDAIAQFTEIIAKGTILLSGKKQEQADVMREAAVKARAFDLFPEMTGKADEDYAGAHANAAAGDYAASAKGYETARGKFEVSAKKAQAQDLRDKINEKDFGKYDEGNYGMAEKKFAEIDEVFESDTQRAVDAADEAILRYNLVIRKGFEYSAGLSKEQTDIQKKKSEEIKAEVAVRDEYANAAAVYDEGVQKLENGDFEGASEKFIEAEPLFADAYANALTKRERAEAALKELAERQLSSEQKAKDAATEIGGGK